MRTFAGRVIGRSAGTAATLLALTACQDVHTPDPGTASDAPAAYASEVVSGLRHPWDIAFLSADEAIVTEKDGNLMHVSLVTGEKTVVRGFPDDLDNQRRDDPRDNSGLFGVVPDPDFAANRHVYVAYSAGDENGTATRVIRGRLSGPAELTDVEQVFLATPLSTERFHYGGGLAFGHDGALYVTIGERYFNEIDQPELPVSQDPTDARGKIYRLNPDGSIPADNPDFGLDAVPGLYALGIRAAQGLTVEPTSGDIWFSEHGPTRGDEINLLEAGGNYGWPLRTSGDYRNTGYEPPVLDDRKLVEPRFAWQETVAPTGLAFYSGSEFPDWRGDLFVAGLSAGSLWKLDIEGRTVRSAERLFPETPIRLRTVKQSPDGRLYLLTDEPDGRILRIEAR